MTRNDAFSQKPIGAPYKNSPEMQKAWAEVSVISVEVSTAGAIDIIAAPGEGKEINVWAYGADNSHTGTYLAGGFFKGTVGGAVQAGYISTGEDSNTYLPFELPILIGENTKLSFGALQSSGVSSKSYITVYYTVVTY